ncbi:DUF1801 domain-containing protein [uncultured Sphaerochaeta sp.]|uniref:YdeI/OmpD-associated family protein n=1 Tax=uncultured Sphaerochaeta sp. TaxID=886478 RepID=UPI002A0A6731|nr:DUF1801 domain-containing protein [uncultured Sphaerochaeta sp.]
MNTRNPKVDEYITKASRWQSEMAHLREILLDCQLMEDFKWGAPCYTFQNANIAIMRDFKDHCVLILCKGSLLQDSAHILVKPGENTQAGRQIRFTTLEEIISRETILKDYMQESILIEKSDLKVIPKEHTELTFPSEFSESLDGSPSLKQAFKALTPGRQRAYIIYFSAPKQSKTRKTRIEKYLPLILQGKGMND